MNALIKQDEKDFIATILLNKKSLIKSVNYINDIDFKHPQYRQIYSGIKDLYNNKKDVCMSNLYDFLSDTINDNNRLDIVIAEIYQSGHCYSQHFDTLLVNTLERSRKEELVNIFEEIKESAKKTNIKTNDIIIDYDKKINDIQKKDYSYINNSHSIKSILNRRDKETRNIIATGFNDLDDLIGGGFRGGQLISVGARTSVGKSAFAQNLCHKMAKTGKKIIYISFEMQDVEMIERALSNYSKIELLKYCNFDDVDGRLGIDEFNTNMTAREELAKLDIQYIKETRKLDNVLNRMKFFCELDKIDFIVIDYLQLIRMDSKESKRIQVGIMTGEFKEFAMEYNIPIMALSQLSRGIEGRINKKPVLSDLKESGDIEQDSDIVILLSRGDSTIDSKLIDVSIAKNRNGRLGDMNLLFDGRFMRFEPF